MGDSIFRKLILVSADTSGLKTLAGDTDRAKAILDKLGVSAGGVNKVTEKSTQVMSQYGKITSQSMYQVETASGKTFNLMIKDGAKASASSDVFTKALMRVAVVVPVWMIARAAIQSVLGTISNGVQQMESFDRAMIKSKAVILDSGMSIRESMVDLDKHIRELSSISGESVTKLAGTFYKFGEVGIKYQDSVMGMEAATALSMATQGDAEEIASSYALAFRLLSNTIDSTIPASERYMSVAAKMYKLWQINAFEQSQFNEGLKAFIPTANVANMTIDQTIALLATLHSAGLQGSMAGTNIRTTFAKFIESLPAVGEKLGIKVDVNQMGVFNSLITVLKELKKVKEEGRLSELNTFFTEIFGGTKGSNPAKALVATFDLLIQNLGITQTDMAGVNNQLKELKDRNEDVTASVSKQMEMLKTNRTNMAEAFVTGIVGGKDFADSLKLVNKWVIENIESAKQWGDSLRLVAIAGGLGIGGVIADVHFKNIIDKANEKMELYDNIQKAMSGKSTIGEMEGVESLVNKGYTDKELDGRQRILDALRKAIDEKNKSLTVDVSILTTNSKINEEVEKNSKMYSSINNSLVEEIQNHKEKLKYIQMELSGSNQAEIAQQKLTDRVKELVDKYNKLKNPITEQPVSQITSTQVTSFLDKGNMSELLSLTGNLIIDEKTIKELLKLQSDIKEKQLAQTAELGAKELTRLELENKLNLIKASGLLSTQEQLSYEIQLIEKSQGLYAVSEKQAKILKLQNEIMIDNVKQVNEFSNKLQGATKDAFKDLLSGKSNTRGFFDQISTFYRETSVDTVSDMLSKNVIGNSGIGQAFGQMMATVKNQNPIEKGFSSGAVMTYNAIVKGFSDGMSGKRSVMTGMGAGGGGLNFGVPNLPGFGGSTIGGTGGGNWWTPPLGGIPGQGYPGATERVGFMGAPVPIAPTNYYRGGSTGGGFMQGLGSFFGFGGNKGGSYANVGGMGNVPVKPSFFQQMGGFGGMVNAGMGIYSTYQTGAAQRGQGSFTGALSGAVSGAMAGTALLPGIGTVIGAIVGGVFAGIMGNKTKKSTTTESSWQPEKASDIQPTVISGGIANLSNPYPLLASRYYSGQQGSKERKNITISIGKIEGANSTEIADKVIERINTEYSREIGRGLNTDY